MKKKLLPISLLCLFGMLLAGCGGNKNKSESQVSSSAESTSSAVASSSTSSSVAAPVAVTGVSLDQETANVVLDQTLQLTATVAPENADNKAVSWSSEDEDIVTVNQEGLVTGVAVGTAKVTVKTADGDFKAVCVVSVIKEITKVEITNKEADAFKAFTVDDMESINVSVDPVDNVTALQAAGALKVSSSDETVATVSGLTITGVKAGKTTITVELFGKSDSFELTVGEAIPGIPHTIAQAFTKASTEAVCTGSSSGTGIAITETCFKFETAKVLAVARNYSSSSKSYSDTAFVVLIDDGTEAVYLQVSKTKDEAIPVVAGDYVEVTCKLSNYYGLFEGVSRKAEEGVRAPYIPLKDFKKINPPETPFTPHLAQAEAMDDAGFSSYYATCKANGVKDATGYNLVKYVELGVTYDENRAETTDQGGYVVCQDATENKKLALQHIGENELDEPFDGQKSTVKAFLIGCNTSKYKANAFIVEQTPLAVESVAFDNASMTILHDHTVQLAYNVTPVGAYDKSVAWSSDHPEFVSVDEKGAIKGVYVGEGTKDAVIKVTIGTGEAAKEASINVKVFGEDVAATAAQLDATAEVFATETITLEPKTTPEMVSDIPQWTSSNPAVATVDQNGVVTGVDAGTANITVKYNDNVSKTCAVTVSWEKGARATDPLTVDEALALVSDKDNGYKTPKQYYFKGYVSEIVENSFGGKYDNATFWLASTEKARGFEGYRLKTVESITDKSNFKVGAEVMIHSVIYKYNATTVENDGGNITAISFEEHPATAITMSENEMVNVGTNITLTPAFVPFYATSAVEWSSSDPTKATVDQTGKVTGVAIGEADITAKVTDDIKAVCHVTVDVPAASYNMKSLSSANTAYATNYDVKFSDEKTWSIPGNQSFNYGTKLGGKGAIGDRVIYSKSTYDTVTSIVITHGTKDSSVTVNSLKLYVYNSAEDAAEGDTTKAIETVVGTYVDGDKTTFAPAAANGNWNGKYFRVVYNLSNSSTSKNYGVVLTQLKVVY